MYNEKEEEERAIPPMATIPTSAIIIAMPREHVVPGKISPYPNVVSVANATL